MAKVTLCTLFGSLWLFHAAQRTCSWAENNDGSCLLLGFLSYSSYPDFTFCRSETVVQGSRNQLLSVWSSGLCTWKVQPRGTRTVHTSVAQYHVEFLALFLSSFFLDIRHQLQDCQRASGEVPTHTVTEISVKLKQVILLLSFEQRPSCIIWFVQLGYNCHKSLAKCVLFTVAGAWFRDLGFKIAIESDSICIPYWLTWNCWVNYVRLYWGCDFQMIERFQPNQMYNSWPEVQFSVGSDHFVVRDVLLSVF